MDTNDLIGIENQIDYKFKNRDLLQQAFVRRSYSAENGGANNEVLEFIGDKALDFVVVQLLTEEYGCWMTDGLPINTRAAVIIKVWATGRKPPTNCLTASVS